MRNNYLTSSNMNYMTNLKNKLGVADLLYYVKSGIVTHRTAAHSVPDLPQGQLGPGPGPEIKGGPK